MDLCEVLLPAYRTIVDTVAQWKQKCGFRTRVKNKLLQIEKDSRRPGLSPHDVQVAKHCVRALKVLKQVSERVSVDHSQFKESNLAELAHLKWSESGYILPPADAQLLLAPLLAACRCSPTVPPSAESLHGLQEETSKEQSTFASLSLQCFQLLVSHRLLQGSAVKGSLVAEVLTSIFHCHHNRALLCRLLDRQEDLESDILQALVIFCSSPVLEVHGSFLSQSFELLLQVQRLSTSAANRCLAKASAAQLLHLSALKAEGPTQVVDPAGASTPLALLPWSSPRMPLADTVKVVQQCVSQLMEEVAFPEQAQVLSLRAVEKAMLGACDDREELCDENSSPGHMRASSNRNMDNLPDIDNFLSDSQGSSVEDFCATTEEIDAAVCGMDGEDAPMFLVKECEETKVVVSGQDCLECEKDEGGAAADTPPGIDTASAATCFILPAFGMATDAVRRSPQVTSVTIGENVVIEDAAVDLLHSDSRAAESRHRVVQWCRTDSCGSAATSSSNNSNVSPASANNRKLKHILASDTLQMQALALEDHSRNRIQAVLLPSDLSVGNLESMDKLFAERDFCSPQMGMAPCSCSTKREESGSSDTQNHQDTILLFNFLCSSLTSKEAAAPRDLPSSSDVPGRANIMEQLLWLLDCCGPHLVHCERIAMALKEHLCPALLHFWTLADPSTFGLCYSVLLRLVMLFRRPLLPALRLFLPHMLLRPLEEPTRVNSRAVWLSLHIFSCIAQQPQILLELYANLDCRVGCGNIVERSVAALAKLSSPNLRTSWEQQHAAGEVLLTVLRSLRRWSSQQNFTAGKRAELCQSEPSVDSIPETVPQEDRGGALVDVLGNASVRRNLKAKQLFQEGVTAFAQQNPIVGLEALRAADEAESGTTRGDGDLLFRFGQSLDEGVVGDLLGKRDSTELLSEYLNCFNFKDVPIDEALRLLLCNFIIPGEAQKIDRIMEAFARRFWQCNACPVHWDRESISSREEQSSQKLHEPAANQGLRPATGSRKQRQGCRCSKVAPFRGGATTAHVLAFSIIMLHTDAHSPAVKSKMSKEDFIRNNRNLDAGYDIPESLLSTLYDRILAEEMTSLRGREGAQGPQAVAQKHHRHSIGLGSRKLKRKNSLPHRRVTTGSLSAVVSPCSSTPKAEEAKAQASSTWGSFGGGRMHRRIQLLSAGKFNSLRVSSPAGLSALQRDSSTLDAGSSGTKSVTSLKNGRLRQPSLPSVPSEKPVARLSSPSLWGPMSLQPFSVFPSTAPIWEPHTRRPSLALSPVVNIQSGRQPSGKPQGLRKSMQRHFTMSGALLQQEVQRLSLSPRGSLASDPGELPGLWSNAKEASRAAAEKRRWRIAMATGICQDSFWPVQSPGHAQAMLLSVAPFIHTCLQAALNPVKEDLANSTIDSESCRESRHVGISRSASMTAKSVSGLSRSISQAGPSLALLHLCKELCVSLHLLELHETFIELVNSVKPGSGPEKAVKAIRTESAVSPLPKKHLDFQR